MRDFLIDIISYG